MEISTQYKNQQLIEALLPTKNFLNLQTLSNIPASPTSTPKINKLYNNNKQKHTQKKTAKIVFFFFVQQKLFISHNSLIYIKSVSFQVSSSSFSCVSVVLKRVKVFIFLLQLQKTFSSPKIYFIYI